MTDMRLLHRREPHRRGPVDPDRERMVSELREDIQRMVAALNAVSEPLLREASKEEPPWRS